jgi:GT2 family glycosyltransferase
MKTKDPLKPLNAQVTAVVLNYRDHCETIACVRKLLELDYIPLHCVVVDNASPNDSLAQLRGVLGREPRVTILSAPSNGGYAAGNNLGARWAMANHRPKYIFIVNPDVRVNDRSTVARLVAFADSHPDAGVVSPKVVLPNGWVQGPYERPSLILSCVKFVIPLVWYVLRSRHQRKSRALATPCRCFRTIGACMMLRAEPFAEVGMFDEGTFLESEEDILAERLSQLEQYFYHYPLAVVVHHHARQGNGKWTIASLKYYFKTYRGASEFALRVLEFCLKFYRTFYLPIKSRLPIIQ